MAYYAQIDDDGVCIGISSLSDDSNDINYIPINSMSDYYLRRVFANGAWTDEIRPLAELESDTSDVISSKIANEIITAISPMMEKLNAIEGMTINIETRNTGPTIFTKLQFQNRFTFAELVAIETAAETTPGVRVLQRQQQSAEFIDLADENTILGIMYLVSIGLLTQERGTEILTP